MTGFPRDLKRIAAVRARPGKVLDIDWQDGSRESVELAGLIGSLPALAALADDRLFAQVEVVNEHTAVGWGGQDDLQLPNASLQRVAEEQRPFGPADFVAWAERNHLSIQETADLLGLTARTIKRLRKDGPINTATAIACRALERDRMALAAHFRPRRASGRPRRGPVPRTAAE